MIATKVCRVCGIKKSVEDYYPTRATCKSCYIQKKLAYYYHTHQSHRRTQDQKIGELHARLVRRLLLLLSKASDKAEFGTKIYLWVLAPHRSYVSSIVTSMMGWLSNSDQIFCHAEDQGLLAAIINTPEYRLWNAYHEAIDGRSFSRQLRKDLSWLTPIC